MSLPIPVAVRPWMPLLTVLLFALVFDRLFYEFDLGINLLLFVLLILGALLQRIGWKGFSVPARAMSLGTVVAACALQGVDRVAPSKPTVWRTVVVHVVCTEHRCRSIAGNDVPWDVDKVCAMFRRADPSAAPQGTAGGHACLRQLLTWWNVI